MSHKELLQHLAAAHLGSAAHQAALSEHHEALSKYYAPTAPGLAKIHGDMADLCKARAGFHERAASELDGNVEPESADVEVGSSSLSSGRSSSAASSKLQRATIGEMIG